MQEEQIVIKVDQFFSSETGVLLQITNKPHVSPEEEHRYYWCERVCSVIITNHRKEEIERVHLPILK